MKVRIASTKLTDPARLVENVGSLLVTDNAGQPIAVFQGMDGGRVFMSTVAEPGFLAQVEQMGFGRREVKVVEVGQL